MLENKTAVILAAGRGKRLKALSQNKPKPMVTVNNVSIIEKLISNLVKNKFSKIVIVVGYMADMIKEHLNKYEHQTEIIYVFNEIFDSTNNIYSLYLAKDYLINGFYLFEADIFCENSIFESMINSTDDNIILIDKYNDSMEGTVVGVDEHNIVTGMYLGKEQEDDFDFSDKFKTVNFYKIGKSFYKEFFKNKLEEYIDKKEVSSYYELIIKFAVEAGYKFNGLKTANMKWWEIDTIEDLKTAEKIFK
ncbi:MAG: phosphocholine cytidylyltransferase family protein [Calditrichia bacterium]|nr:phosphocholine cytidylyltransferase family protein [Calditrichia bacterium]